MPPRHATFTFTHRVIERGIVRLGFRLSGGPDAPLDLEETFTLPAELGAGVPDSIRASVERALLPLHLACGTSYWKTSCPADVRVEGEPLAGADAAFAEILFAQGLGEFFFRNDLLPPPAPRFPRAPETERSIAPAAPPATVAAGPPLVLLGGGKDSAVSVDLLEAAGEEPVLLAVGRHPWIRRAAEASGRPLLVAERALDPGLFELNARGALNGHVPVTAILMALARVIALLGGHAAVVASNERSASVAHVIAGGLEINHQWSKGLAFERALQAIGERHVPGAPAVFSLLRPFSELAIARMFARSPRWFGAVTSCNANFAIAARPGTPRWCGTCPKCAFVFAVTTPWLADDGRATLFGGVDPLADARNVPLFEELLGLARHVPFECVGTPEETAAALWASHDRGLHADSPVMALFRDRVLPSMTDPAAALAACLRRSEEDAIPERWKRVLDAAG